MISVLFFPHPVDGQVLPNMDEMADMYSAAVEVKFLFIKLVGHLATQAFSCAEFRRHWSSTL